MCKDKIWAMTHAGYIYDWENMQRVLVVEKPQHDQRNFDRYLQWLHRSTHTHMSNPYTNKPIDEDKDEDGIADAYNETTRMETQL